MQTPFYYYGAEQFTLYFIAFPFRLLTNFRSPITSTVVISGRSESTLIRTRLRELTITRGWSDHWISRFSKVIGVRTISNLLCQEAVLEACGKRYWKRAGSDTGSGRDSVLVASGKRYWKRAWFGTGSGPWSGREAVLEADRMANDAGFGSRCFLISTK